MKKFLYSILHTPYYLVLEHILIYHTKKLRILSKSKGEASRCIVYLHRDLHSDLPRPYTTLKFEEDTKLLPLFHKLTG